MRMRLLVVVESFFVFGVRKRGEEEKNKRDKKYEKIAHRRSPSVSAMSSLPLPPPPSPAEDKPRLPLGGEDRDDDEDPPILLRELGSIGGGREEDEEEGGFDDEGGMADAMVRLRALATDATRRADLHPQQQQQLLPPPRATAHALATSIVVVRPPPRVEARAKRRIFLLVAKRNSGRRRTPRSEKKMEVKFSPLSAQKTKTKKEACRLQSTPRPRPPSVPSGSRSTRTHASVLTPCSSTGERRWGTRERREGSFECLSCFSLPSRRYPDPPPPLVFNSNPLTTTGTPTSSSTRSTAAAG